MVWIVYLLYSEYIYIYMFICIFRIYIYMFICIFHCCSLTHIYYTLYIIFAIIIYNSTHLVLTHLQCKNKKEVKKQVSKSSDKREINFFFQNFFIKIMFEFKSNHIYVYSKNHRIEINIKSLFKVCILPYLLKICILPHFLQNFVFYPLY